MNTIFKALNDPTRRQILQLLQDKDMTAGEIVERFKISGPSISHHLDLLKQANLVIAEKDGQYVYYSLNTTVVDEIIKWLIQFKTKNKMTRYFKYLIWLIALVPLVYLLSIWKGLPEEMAMHFDLKGNPDRFGNKSELLVMAVVLSAMSILIYFVLSNIYKIDPKKYA